MDAEPLEKRIRKKAPGMLKPSRWEHSLRTADYAVFLARRYGVSEQPCRIAALAHDLARDQRLGRQRAWAVRELGGLPDFVREAPLLLHGPASAWYLRRRMGCRDESVLKAVCYHTTGHPGLDETGLIVFAADYMEPGRIHLDDTDRARLLDQSLDGLAAAILDSMEHYLLSMGVVPAPWSRELCQSLKNRYNGAL